MDALRKSAKSKKVNEKFEKCLILIQKVSLILMSRIFFQISND